MSGKKSKAKPSSQGKKRQANVWRGMFAGLLILSGIAVALLWDRDEFDTDLSLIGKGENIVVQIHDPGCPECRKLKRVVSSLKKEYAGKIRFLITNIQTDEGRHFARYHEVSNVTLLFFRPDGSKIASLKGVQDADFLRRAFNRTFNLTVGLKPELGKE